MAPRFFKDGAFCSELLSPDDNVIVTAFPNGSSGKESTCNAGDAGDMGLTLGREDALEKEMAILGSVALAGLVTCSHQLLGPWAAALS